MNRVLWFVAFLLLVVYLRVQVKRDEPYIKMEQQCIQDAVGYDGMQECFKLMERNKAIREQR